MALIGSVLPEGWRKAIVAIVAIAAYTAMVLMKVDPAVISDASQFILLIAGGFLGGNVAEHVINNKNNHMPKAIKEDLTNG